MDAPKTSKVVPLQQAAGKVDVGIQVWVAQRFTGCPLLRARETLPQEQVAPLLHDAGQEFEDD